MFDVEEVRGMCWLLGRQFSTTARVYVCVLYVCICNLHERFNIKSVKVDEYPVI
jgi:hypothetical protein